MTSSKPVRNIIWEAVDYPEELTTPQFADWARAVAKSGGTHVVVGGLPLSRWQLRDARDPHPEWISWPIWSIHNPSIFKLVTPPELQSWIPAEEGRHAMKLLKERCAILRELGLKGAFLGNDPMWLPESVYEAHPEWRGAQGELSRIAHLPYFSPCIDNPEVLAMYRQSMTEIARQLPEIDTYSFFTNDSCGGVCWTTPYPGNNGPEACRHRSATERVLGFLDAIYKGALDAGVKIALNLDNIRYAPIDYHAIPAGLSINSRTSDGQLWKTDAFAGHYIFDQIYPLVGIPRPLQLLFLLEKAMATDAPNVFIGRWRHAEGTHQEVSRLFLKQPTNGPASRMALLRDAAATLVGAESAEDLLAAWEAIENACIHLQHVQFKGFFNILLAGPAMMRWLLMPLVPDITRLTAEEKADYIHHRVACNDFEMDSYHCILGEPGITSSSGVWMARHAVGDAMEDVDNAVNAVARISAIHKDKAVRDSMELLIKRLRAWRCCMVTARNFIDYQYTLSIADPRHTRMLWRPERFGNNDISASSIALRQIARAEADNVVALSRLLDATPAALLVMAATPQLEDSFHFSPDLAKQLRRKSAIMMAHWRDYLELFPALPQTDDGPSAGPLPDEGSWAPIA